MEFVSKRELSTPSGSVGNYIASPNQIKLDSTAFKHYGSQFSYRSFYRQELDELLEKKNKAKLIEKQKQEEERRRYNQQLKLNTQAERIKDLSYKNYYHMISKNQQDIRNKYINPFGQRDETKNKLIERGISQGRMKNQAELERQLLKQQNMKRQLKEVLKYQVKQKEQFLKRQNDQRIQQNKYLRNELLTPVQVQKLERSKKFLEKTKYRQDLDQIQRFRYNLSQSQFKNPESSPKIIPEKHDLLLNPLPFNIQNPYILKQMEKRSSFSNTNFKSQSNANLPFSHKILF